MTRELRLWQVDAFTSTPFRGNPAAVVVHEEPLDDALMQDIAMEMNLSETAFVLLRKGQNPLLRWFTSVLEIDLCGHATMASAHACLTEIMPSLNEITFDTKFVGPLKVTRAGNKYTMDFPSRPGDRLNLKDVPRFVLDALTQVQPVEAYKSRDLMLVYEDEDTLRAIDPDFRALLKYGDFVIVTAPSRDPGYDFISRFFCANDGMPEDPVTGSAHCTSAPYWAKKLGKNELKAWQASKRGGALDLRVTDSNVFITGEAVTVMQAVLKV